MERKLDLETTLSYGNKTYVIVRHLLNWVDAVEYAKFMGGHLATIPDEATNVYLSTQVKAMGLGGAYIGLTDQDKEGVWVWQSGSTASYRKWAKGEPNSHDQDRRVEDHAVMRANGEWNDYMGYAHGHTIPFIVEIP